MSYYPLHCHTYYSALDGVPSPEEYFDRAKEIGVDGYAITDHGTTMGHRDALRAANKTGMKLGLGIEAYHTDDMYDRRSKASRQDGTDVYNHLTIVAKNDEGLRNLNHMNKLSWSEGFYSKPRIGKDLVFENGKGLIVTSGCMSGMIARAVLNDMPDRADAIAREHKENLGDDFYIEVMATNSEALNRSLLDIADRNKIKPVMTSDCHYARKEDLDITETMMILSTNPKKNFNADLSKAQKMDFLDRLNYLYPDRKMTFQEIEVYMRTVDEERALFRAQGIDREDIYQNTLEIRDKIEGYTYHEGLDLLPQPSSDPREKLRELSYKGLVHRKIDKPEYRKRLEDELEVIFEKNFETYFLIVRDMIMTAKKKGIRTGFGRGSSAGSLVNYVLGITEVDPVKYNLLFWRFLDAGDATYDPEFEVIN